MKKFDIVKAIKNNNQLILCECGSGLTVRFVKINFVKQTPTKQLVFTTEAGDRVVLKANRFDASEYNACGKYSDCFVKTMNDVENACRFLFIECKSIAF